MQTVAVLAFPGVVAFDLASACHVFGDARATTSACAATGPAPAGTFDFVPRHGLEAARGADVVVVPGTDAEDVEAAVIERRAARDRHGGARSARAPSCSAPPAGSTAAAARPTGATRTSSPAAHPTATVEPDVLFVDEGDLLTSAGVAAGIDLCLHIVARDRGAAVANQVARRMVVAPQRTGGQAQFIERPVPDRRAAGSPATRAWMLERLAEPLTVERMAAHAGYSPRTFARRFRAETGTTPLAWLLAQRVAGRAAAARGERRSRSSRSPRSAGSAPRPALREHFRRATRTTPTAYREAFSATPRATSTSVRVAKPEPPLAA